MKKMINQGKYIAITVLISLFFQAESAAQLSVGNQWQQRMEELMPVIKQDAARGFMPAANMDLSTKSPNDKLTREEFMEAKCALIATFSLDYASFYSLTSKSKLETLIKLDTTRFDFDIFDNKLNQYVLASGGMFLEGRWRTSGRSAISPYAIDFRTRIHESNIPLYRLQVERTPEGGEKGFYFYIENGKFMTMTFQWLRPFLDVLLEYLEDIKYREALYQGVLDPPLPASYQRFFEQQKKLEMQKK